MNQEKLRKCIICGREFVPYRNMPTHKTCSIECRKEQTRRKNRENYQTFHEEILRKQRSKARRLNNGTVLCRICGRPVYRDWETKANHGWFHDECIYDDIIETLANGERVSILQRQRLYSRGYTLKEFIEDFENEISDK